MFSTNILIVHHASSLNFLFIRVLLQVHRGMFEWQSALNLIYTNTWKHLEINKEKLTQKEGVQLLSKIYLFFEVFEFFSFVSVTSFLFKRKLEKQNHIFWEMWIDILVNINVSTDIRTMFSAYEIERWEVAF